MPSQVITDRPRGPIHVGPYRIVFRYRKHMEKVARGIERRDTDTGHMKISSAELTTLDPVRYPGEAGGVERIAATLAVIAALLNPDRLSALSIAFERSVAQRLGHLLERLGYVNQCGLYT